MSRVPVRKRFGLWTVAGGALFALLLIISLFSTGIGGLLIMAGLIAFVTGLYVVVTRRPSWAGLPAMRRVGAAVAAGGLVVLMVGGAAYGAMNPREVSVTPVATSSPTSHGGALTTPRPTPSRTVTSTPTLTATPTPTPTPTEAPADPAQPAPAPAQPAPAPAQPAPAAPQPEAPPAPAPEPAAPATVHPGAFCSSAGATGVSKNGVPMVCTTTAEDSRLRWRAA